MERIEVNVQTGEQRTVALTEAEIAEIQSRPQPEPPAVRTPAEKLAAAGLTVDELRELLGLNTAVGTQQSYAETQQPGPTHSS